MAIQLQHIVTVKNRDVSRDHERIEKREVTSLSKCGQLEGWNREMMPNVTWIRTEFVQTAGYEPTLNVVQLLSIFTS